MTVNGVDPDVVQWKWVAALAAALSQRKKTPDGTGADAFSGLQIKKK